MNVAVAIEFAKESSFLQHPNTVHCNIVEMLYFTTGPMFKLVT